MTLPIVVVSTGYNVTTKRLCLRSVKGQVGVEFRHMWVDAKEQTPSKQALDNLTDMIVGLPPETVVAHLDLDDWFYDENALRRVAAEHEAGAWMTYGSFVVAEDAQQIVRPGRGHAPDENVRTSLWLASHLKTFRAGLWQKIRREDFEIDGETIYRAIDHAAMIPMLEMTGHDRAVFIRDPLVVYNWGVSFERTANDEELAYERECVKRIRAKAPYTRLESLG